MNRMFGAGSLACSASGAAASALKTSLLGVAMSRIVELSAARIIPSVSADGFSGKARPRAGAGIKCREIIVLGTIDGNVEALDKIDIRRDAKLVGDIKTARIIIEDGAYFKGSIDIVKNEQPKPAQPRPQATAATAAYAPV